jgi:hypothetical protein
MVVPPDYPCLLAEMDRLVATYHPLVVNWVTTLCSQCYEEIARNRVIAAGGVGFSDGLSNALQPYFYAADESASRIETAFAEFWCNQLSSRNDKTRVVRFAGHQNRAQDFNGHPRVLGVISTNDPDNEQTVKNVLFKQLHARCGEDVTHVYFYDQDPNTAARQVTASIANMDTPSNPATDVLCLCDPVAPTALYDGEQTNNYYPENLIASDQFMDTDLTGQSYGPGADGSPSQGCPSPQLGCEYDLAFGLSSLGEEEPQGNTTGVRVFHAGGGQQLPASITPVNATLLARGWIMLANLIENAGVEPTPDHIKARAIALGGVGGGSSNDPLLEFRENDWHWTQDNRVVFWSRHRASRYDGLSGTYVQVEGGRFDLGQLPVLQAGPPIPVVR